MLRILLARLQQKRRTVAYPAVPAVLPPRFQGVPRLQPKLCPAGCDQCAAACPSAAISRPEGGLRLDLGRCIFCGACASACPSGAVAFSRDHRLCARKREDLFVGEREYAAAQVVKDRIHSLFGRSLKLRQVSAGGCNACEADINVLTTVVFDLGRFGIQVVASPRHADGLLVTGPVTENMRLALLKTWEATPAPKVVIAVGTCACSGGIFRGHPEQHDGVEKLLPVDLYIPGCPPHPYTILDGLLRLTGRLVEAEKKPVS